MVMTSWMVVRVILFFSGSFDDYRINAAGDGFLVSDSVEFRDGVDLVTNVEFFVFPDQSSAGLNALVAQKDNSDEELVGLGFMWMVTDLSEQLSDGLLITAQAIEISCRDRITTISVLRPISMTN